MPTVARINHQKSAGAAMVEFAIVLPLMIFLFSALVETGRILSELNWLANTGYHLGVALAGSPREVGESFMASRKEQLVESIRKVEFAVIGLEVAMPEPLNGGSFYEEQSKTVGLKFSASIRSLMSVPFNLPMIVEVTGPMLVVTDQIGGQYGEFRNPSTLYDCCGTKCGTGPGCGGTLCTYTSSGPQDC